ncbi:MAG: CDP-alcohol phosphatidyltransferase [Microbacteriaceae bacterium]|jgi:phosphatidylglycerophosphate synthase|nr:CDP-alcohol phosphatidyltransferase [Microbacteriaceae bacterium]
MGGAQKPGRGAPPYSRWVNRRFGRWLAAAAYVIGLTPNQVTLISAAMTFSSLALVIFVVPSWWLGVLVALLLLLGYALDSADGQLARLRGGGSKSGEWLDHVVDATKIGVMHSAVLISFYRFSAEKDSPVLLVPLGFMVVSFVFFFGMTLTDQLRRSAAAEAGKSYAKPSGGGGAMQTLVAIPTDYAVLCLSFVLLGAHQVFVVVYILLFVAQAVILAAVLVRWWRELRRIDLGG